MWAQIRKFSLVVLLVVGLLGGVFHHHELSSLDHQEDCVICRSQNAISDVSADCPTAFFIKTVELGPQAEVCFYTGQFFFHTDTRAPPFVIS